MLDKFLIALEIEENKMYKSDGNNTENYGKLNLDELIKLDLERFEQELEDKRKTKIEEKNNEVILCLKT